MEFRTTPETLLAASAVGKQYTCTKTDDLAQLTFDPAIISLYNAAQQSINEGMNYSRAWRYGMILALVIGWHLRDAQPIEDLTKLFGMTEAEMEAITKEIQNHDNRTS